MKLGPDGEPENPVASSLEDVDSFSRAPADYFLPEDEDAPLPDVPEGWLLPSEAVQNLDVGQLPTPPVIEPPATPEPEPRPVLVIGSFDWDKEFIVQGVLMTHHLHAPIAVVTAGCPQGAEAQATVWAQTHGLQASTIRDEDIPQVTGAFAVAFIKDHSEGAEKVLATIIKAGIWVEVYRVDTTRNVSPWAAR
jgi:hypothetical protein